MSEFKVEVVRVGPIRKHPNADTLSITDVHGGYPCIIRTGEFREGGLAVYVPITAVVPADDERWAFLGAHREIEAKRLRGVFSMGLLTKADPSWELGRDVAAELRIVRAEAPEPTEGNEADPGLLPVYTDIPALRAFGDVLFEGGGASAVSVDIRDRVQFHPDIVLPVGVDITRHPLEYVGASAEAISLRGLRQFTQSVTVDGHDLHPVGC
jgi:tRNA-binding EMAP/Myf-like protein